MEFGELPESIKVSVVVLLSFFISNEKFRKDNPYLYDKSKIDKVDREVRLASMKLIQILELEEIIAYDKNVGSLIDSIGYSAYEKGRSKTIAETLENVEPILFYKGWASSCDMEHRRELEMLLRGIF